METNEEAEAGQNGDRHDYADAEDEAEVIECMQEDAAEEAEAEQNGDRDDYDDAEDEAEGNEWKQENAEEEAEAKQNGDSNDYFDAEDEAGKTKRTQENARASGEGDEAQDKAEGTKWDEAWDDYFDGDDDGGGAGDDDGGDGGAVEECYYSKFHRLANLQLAASHGQHSFDRTVLGLKAMCHESANKFAPPAAVRDMIMHADNDAALSAPRLQPIMGFELIPGEWEHRNLNPSQMRAIETAYNRTGTLIVGPPGTGKTTVIDLLFKCLVRGHNGHFLGSEAKPLVTGAARLPISKIAVDLRRKEGIGVLRAFVPLGDPAKFLDLRTTKEQAAQLAAEVVCWQSSPSSRLAIRKCPRPWRRRCKLCLRTARSGVR